MLRMLVWCMLAFMATGAYGQNTIGLPLIRNYTKTEFKGGSQTWEIDQDKYGRIYFANNEGLLVYDGAYWKLYPLPNKTIMRSVTIGPDGRIYVGGQGEAGYFLPNDRGFLTYHSLMQLLPADQRDVADIWDIELHGESIFFRAMDRILEYANQTIRSYRPANEWIYMQQAGGRLLAQDSRLGLFAHQAGQWVPIAGGNLIGSDAVQAAIPVSPDSLLLTTYSGKQYWLQNSGLAPAAGMQGMLSSQVFTAVSLNSAEYVLGTVSQGCMVLNKQGGMVQRLGMAEGLQDNNVLCSFVDRSGNLWVGLNHGISVIAYNAAIKYIRPDGGNELSGYSSRVFQQILYVATSNGVYQIPMTGATNADLSFHKSNFGIVAGSQGLAYRLDEINQRLLLAHNEGTFEIRNAAAQRLSSEPSWLFVPLSGVVPAQQILSGNYTGIRILNYNGQSFLPQPNLAGIRESLRFLAIDNQQRVWASHPYRGVYQLPVASGSQQVQPILYTSRQGLPSDLDNHVFRIKNRVVFATVAGVYEFNDQTGRFAPSAFLQPLLGQMPVRYLYEDGDGHIWFVTGKTLGVLVYDAAKKAYRTTFFPEMTGQILSGFENVYAYNNQNVFVGSEKGVIHLNLSKYLGKTRQPSVILSGVRAVGLSDSIMTDGYWMDSASNSKSQIRLPYSLNSLHLEYSAPAYGFQENIEYSYLLEGYDKAWSKWSGKTEKDYTNLPNGNYVFKVKARSNLGAEIEVALCSIAIAPPWYKSFWMYGVYLILALSGIWLLRSMHHKRLRRQRLKFEENQTQLRVLHQLEMEKNEKEIMRLQNEHLSNEVTFKNKELAESTMHLVERSDAMAKVKEELQRLYKSSQGNNDLKRAINLIIEMERNNADWDRFAASFDEINSNFLKKLKSMHPSLTNNDLKLSAYLQLKMSTKEIAQLLNISVRGVEISRYRLRKKLGIPTETSISDFLTDIMGVEDNA